MVKKTAKPHICLVCWNPSKAEQHEAALKKAGYRITLVTAPVKGWISYFRDLQIDAVAIDLDRLPSHGREVGLSLHASRSTRHLPLAFLGGDPAKVARVRTELPGASFAEWTDAKSAIDHAIAMHGTTPIEKRGVTPIAIPTPQHSRAQDTDLARRLGLKPDVPTVLWGSLRGALRGDADFLIDLLGDASASVSRPPAHQPCLCLAVTRRSADVDAVFDAAATTYATGSSVWIIHPKQSGRYATDFNQNDVRTIGLAHGWVDYKVCSVDSDWSGLKFARRRPGQALQPRSMKHVAD